MGNATMTTHCRFASRLFGLVIGISVVLVGSTVQADGLVGKWLGQDGHDLVGGEPGPSKNDYQDIHIAIKGLPADREVAEVIIQGHGGGEWKTSNKNRFTVQTVRAPRSNLADLYVEPYTRETGREFVIKVKLDNGQQSETYINGGKADPNLRMPGLGMEVKWLGQDGDDRTGPTLNVGPDGFEDVHLALSKLTAKAEIRSVEVAAPGGPAWHFGLNPKGLTNAELVRHPDDKSKADLYFSPARDLAGQSLKVTVTYGDDRGDSGTIAGQKVNPAKAMPKASIPTIVLSKATATWLGQDGLSPIPGDVHVAIEGIAANRSIAAAVLSDGAVSKWLYRANDKIKLEVGYGPDRLQIRRDGPNRLDLVFPVGRDESHSTMTLRLIDPSGREEILRFPGGKADPDLRAPTLPAGTVTARPGDDLNDLASKYGTVHLSQGVYRLSKPLVLTRPVRIVGEAGSTLLFSQNGDQPPWTTAIKIHSGGTTLEGFAVRFEGLLKWDRDVSFGPAVIGTTDNRDGNQDGDRFRVILSRLDLEGPPPTSDWEEAVHLIRVVSASSGRIEKNRFKGGAVIFNGGPWTIADNVARGTLPKTFIYELFGGRYTHDLVLTGNKQKDEGPSGKSWRFLVLAQRGVDDLIRENTIEGGIGPREDDVRQHQNSPEVILTEAYRLHFEGKPAAIANEGRLLAIPRSESSPADVGDSVAILSGPQAGQWRSIAQVLGPRLYWLDEPIAKETEAVSIATGFVRETFERNTVDCRGSGIADNIVLAGNLFGVKLVGNHLLGGNKAIRIQSMPTEEPNIWGWSHAPFLGATISGNVIEDSCGSSLGVDHDLKAIKTNKGRAYLSFEFLDNTFRWTGVKLPSGKPPRVEISTPPSFDPGEMIVKEAGTKVEGAPARTIWVHSATINGKVVKDSPLRSEGSVGTKASGSGPNRRE
jgi:hypothetical protein